MAPPKATTPPAGVMPVAGPNGGRPGDDGPQGRLDFSARAEPRVFPVSDIVRQASRLLADRFSDIWVEGEVDSFKRHGASGHLYFTLKDGGARLDAMMPRLKAQRVRFPVQDGMKVRARGRLSLYEALGKFQFYVDELELSGEGELLRAFEELKQRLQREGLFARERKRPLPPFPRRIGVATSESGAALQDILRVAFRRGRVQVLIAPCQVQGEGAAPQICAAIARLEPHVDVIIVGRGGGSSADLWAFNDEALARVIFKCRVPVVSAVGHEVDYTIADFVADLRAPTPSAAAELVVPLFASLEAEAGDLRARLFRAGQRVLDAARQRLDTELQRGEKLLLRQIGQQRRQLGALSESLTAQHPRARLLRDRAVLEQLRTKLRAQEQELLLRRRRAFEGLCGKLDALSPLKVLDRGYAVARDGDGHVVTDAHAVPPGGRLAVRLRHGELACRVEEVREAEEPPGSAPATAEPCD